MMNSFYILKFKFISILFLTVGITLNAQEKKDLDLSFLKSVYNTYNTANSYQMEVKVNMFDNKEILTYSVQNNYTIKSNENFYIQTPELTTVNTSDFQIVIIPTAKEVRYIAYNKKQQDYFKTKQLKSVIPNLYEQKDLIASITQSALSTTIVLKKSPTYKKTVYTFNSSSKLLECVDFYSEGQEYGQPAHIKIEYITRKFNEKIDASAFKLTKYLIVSKGKLKLSKAYESYNLIDNTITP